ncbi:MAG: glutamine amidotransferase [Bradyrhizobium sp.]|uniref:glutamine amidotransferase n=1 Tax=Bradyrhizobium sp. TaxID=376 RepID=UPI001C28BA1C|nr:glutamine amidotransferase [Bradyrhizobium sp.]MBU6462880.1 glutamine amidotransferase [Pseudomonadota bacterium]MDE2065998.1 glutamine amidotransferase [Bradyrhizobium sp.]MDE2244141.1 glutamine amidotransferase [Bradyrhizobium sp.]MDE2471010.1 glutamine amidotransferase [Bradyrhizobium sp.]
MQQLRQDLRHGPAQRLLPVLIVLHQEASTPGRVGNALRALGYPLDIRRPRFGDPLPETLDRHAGAVIFGGPMSANDSDDYVRREIDWIAVPLREQRPFMGICLGAQMLAKQLGAAVAPHRQGRTQMGYYPIRPTALGHVVCPGWPSHVYHWHLEGFELPAGADLLAEGSDFPVQAIQLGHAFGFQFHPDVTYAMMHSWTTHGCDRLTLPGARERHHHFADRAVHDVTERAWLKRFLDGWLTRMPMSVMLEAAE